MATPSSIPPLTRRFDIFEADIPNFPQVDYVIIFTSGEVADISATSLVIFLMPAKFAGPTSFDFLPATRYLLNGGPKSFYGFTQDYYATVDFITTIPKSHLANTRFKVLKPHDQANIEALVKAWMGFARFPASARTK